MSAASSEPHPLFEKFLTKEQLAEHLGLSPSMVSKLMRQGLPYYKFGRAVRYRSGEVAAWLQKRRYP